MSTDAARRRRSVGFTYEGLTEIACKPLSLYPEQPPSRLICQIGKGVFTQPVRSVLCNHQFCRGCINELLKSSKRCPVGGCEAVIDHESLESLEDLEEELAGLTVICTNKPKGCEWQGPVRDVSDHMKMCKRSLPILCEMCRRRIPRDQMAQHATKDCPKLPAVCKWCNVDLLAADLPYHLGYECTNVPPEEVPNPLPPPREGDLGREEKPATPEDLPPPPRTRRTQLIEEPEQFTARPAFDPSASPRGSILRKNAWSSTPVAEDLNPFPARRTSVDEAQAVSPPSREQNDSMDAKRLGQRKRRVGLAPGAENMGREGGIGSCASPSPVCTPSDGELERRPSMTREQALTVSPSCPPGPDLNSTSPTSASSSKALLEAVNKARSALQASTRTEQPNDPMMLLLSAVQHLQDRLTSLELENASLKSLLADRPSSGGKNSLLSRFSPSPSHSPTPSRPLRTVRPLDEETINDLVKPGLFKSPSGNNVFKPPRDPT